MAIELPAFVRGILKVKSGYLLGQSETLYMKRVKKKPYLMMNSGINIFDNNSGLLRFYPTFGLKNIHSLCEKI